MIRALFAFVFAACLVAAAAAMAPSNNLMLMLPHKHAGITPVMIPINTGGANLPTVSGTPQVGQMLTGTNGIWANNPTSYRYMWTWEDCGTDNTRTAITTSPIASDVGHQLCFSVWAKNAAGESVRVEAALTATVIQAAAFNPANPGASGYAMVFDDEFNSISTIDVNNTQAPGFNWYTGTFGAPTPANYIQVSGGALTLLQSANNISYGISTAGQANNADGFVGRAFGGGAYFEASVKFNPANVNPATTNWPSFWGMSLERQANNSLHSPQWPGQPAGYDHFMEADFFEFDLGTTTAYNNAIHDWYGQIGQCGGSWYCDINNNPQGGNGGTSSFTNGTPSVPGGTDWTQYHRIGELWVPGTAANGNQGYLQGYFDGVPTTDKVTWTDSGTGSPPPAGAFQFSIIDQQHLNVVLGTGTTNNIGFTIDWVHVWQNAQGTCIGSGCTSPSAPAIVPGAPPTVSGTAQAGQILTGTNGTWTNNPTGYRYMWTWEDCGIDNTRTAISTSPIASDVGHQLCFSVWAHNASGESTRVMAALTATVTQASQAGIWTASNYANSGVRGFNQPGDMSLASFQEAAGFGAKVMRVFINNGTGGGTNNLSNNGSQYTIGGGAPGTFDFTSLDGIVANAQAAGLKVILVVDDAAKGVLTNTSLQNSFVAMWQAIATHYVGNTTIGGYDLYNEPAINGSEAQWIPVSQTTTAAIRAIDPAHVIIWEPFPWALPYSYNGMTTMPLASYTNIVYSYHDYEPHLFTSQTLGGYPYGVVYPTTGNATISCYPGGAQLSWTAATRGPNSLNCDGSGTQTILNLQAQYGFQIFVGELSAFTAAPTNASGTPSSTQWVDDTLAYLRGKGMSYAYHSWNEWWGWDATVDQSVAISLYNSNGTNPYPPPKNQNSLTSQVLKRHFSEP